MRSDTRLGVQSVAPAFADGGAGLFDGGPFLESDMKICFTGQALIRSDLRGCNAKPFRDTWLLLKSADHVFSNLEGAVRGRHGGWPFVGGENFPESDPIVLDCLKDMGVDMLSLANNHSYDIGPGGVLSTIEEVARRGIMHAGTGIDKAASQRAGILADDTGSVGLIAVDAGPQPDFVYATSGTAQVPARPGVNQLRVQPRLVLPDADLAYFRELSARLGHERFKQAHARYGFKMVAPDGITYWDQKDAFTFFGLTLMGGAEAAHGTGMIDPVDLERHAEIVRTTRTEVDTLIVYLHSHHWQPEFSRVPDWIVTFAHAMIDAGATAFVAHGMPQLHGMEVYKGRPIFYSLGNFIFHLMPPRAVFDAPEVWESVIAMVDVDANHDLAGIVLKPIILTGESGKWEGQTPRLYPMQADAAACDRILTRIEALSVPFGTRFARLDGGSARIVL
jgi:poly-gamma-glutamate capsule biosynthesis protein CapA/YwtB (metallophosphatase superfamily)